MNDFATPLGLEKMKEAMKAVAKSGLYSFSDDSVRQGLLFDFDAVWREGKIIAEIP